MIATMFLILCLFLGVQAYDGQDTDQEGMFSYSLEQSFSLDDNFSLRGRVNLEYTSTRGKVGVVRFSKETLSDADAQKLRALAQSGGHYRLRILVNDKYLMASVPACALLNSGLKEYMTFHSDVYGNLVSFDYHVLSYDCSENIDLVDYTFQTKARISLGRAGEKVRNIRSHEEAIQEAAARQKGGITKPAEKTFFQKYWMYIMMAVLFMTMGGGDQKAPAAKK